MRWRERLGAHTRYGGAPRDEPFKRRLVVGHQMNLRESSVQGSVSAWAYLGLLVVLNSKPINEAQLSFQPINMLFFGI